MPPDATGPAGAGGGWRAPDDAARPFHRLLHAAAQSHGARLLLEPRYRYLGRLVWADGTARPVLGAALGLNGDAAAGLAADKTYAAQVLAEAGLPVPEGMLHVTESGRAALALKNAAVARALPGPERARDWAERQGFPVFLKPNRGSEGADVCRATDAADLSADLEALSSRHTHLRLEAACPGADLRVLVLEGRARMAYLRHPLRVTGDGRQTLAALIEARLEALARDHRGAKISADDLRLARTLAVQGLTPACVPAKAVTIDLLPGANLSTGGTLEDVTDRLPDETARLAVRAAAALGLRLAGVDLRVPDPALSPEGACVLEVNSAPGLDFYASSGPEAAARVEETLRDAVALLRP